MLTLKIYVYIVLKSYVDLWCLTPPSTVFQLNRGVNYIGGANRSTRREPPTYRKSLTVYHNVVSSTPAMSGTRTHNLSW